MVFVVLNKPRINIMRCIFILYIPTHTYKRSVVNPIHWYLILHGQGHVGTAISIYDVSTK